MFPAPVFSDIANRIIKYRDLKPYEMNTLKKQDYKELKGNYKTLVEMPDLKGRSMRKAMRILSDLDVNIEAKGKGVIKKQIPKKGTPLKNIKEIKLYLD